MISTRRRGWLLAPLAGLLFTACAVQPDVVALEATKSKAQVEPTTTSSAPTTVPTTTPIDPTPASTVPFDPNAAGPDALNGGNTETEIFGSVDYNSTLRANNSRVPQPQDEMVALAVADIERWWGEQYPAIFGGEFTPLKGGIFPGSPESTVEMPSCDDPGATMDYETLQELTAFYCPEGDFIAFDDAPWSENILTTLSEEFGPAVFAVMLAHEYGHAIQARVGVFDTQVADIYPEQQADCYSGAWVAQSYNGNSPLLRLGDKDVRTSLLAMLELRDPVGTNQLSLGGHGAAFDRVGAFQEGFLKGPGRCAELIDQPLQLIPNEFISSAVEAYTQGNAPYDCAELSRDDLIDSGFSPAEADAVIAACIPGPTMIQDDLNSFWKASLGPGFPTLTAQAVPSLESVACADSVRLNDFVLLCPSQQLVAYSEPGVVGLYHDFGDFTMGYLLGIAWAEQGQIYAKSSLAGEPRALLDDCFVGAWARDITPQADGQLDHTRDADGDGEADAFSTSPGDLDEATRMAIVTGDLGSAANVAGTAFDKIAALRHGMLGGYPACASLLPPG